jgi:hypothetical protein
MSTGIVLVGAAMFLGALARRGQRNHSLERAAKNLKAATTKVDASAAAVEIALAALRAP